MDVDEPGSSGLSDPTPGPAKTSLTSHFEAMYKSKGLTPDELRRRRKDDLVQLRKQRKDDDLNARRSLDMLSFADAESRRLSQSEEFVDSKIREDLFNSDPDMQLRAVRALRDNMRQRKEPLLGAIASSNLIPRLSELFLKGDGELLEIVAWILANLDSSPDSQGDSVSRGVVKTLVRLLSVETTDLVSEQLLWALANIASDSADHRDLVVAYDVVDALEHLFQQVHRPVVIRNATWLASQLFRRHGHDDMPEYDRMLTLLEPMSRCLFSGDEVTVQDACSAFHSFSDVNDVDDTMAAQERLEYLLACDIVPQLVYLLSSPEEKIRFKSLQVIGNILAFQKDYMDAVLSNGFLDACLPLLGARSTSKIEKELCCSLNFIAAGSPQQLRQLTTHAVIFSLLSIAQKATYQSRKEAAFTLTTVIHRGDAEALSRLVSGGVVAAFCDLLTTMDVNLVIVVLDALETLLHRNRLISPQSTLEVATRIEECGGVDKIEFLISSPSLEVNVKAHDIYTTFFCEEEDPDTREDELEEGGGFVVSSTLDDCISFVANGGGSFHF